MKQKLVRLIIVVLMCTAAVWAGKYEPNWESLTTHEVPQWLQDAKFGIYAHWGLYSVPAFGHEWYGKHMYNPAHPIHKKHVERFGDPSSFGYKDFIPMFTAENYNPDHWAKIIKQSGARYAGLAMAHHDNFGLWDSDVYEWHVGKKGPKRDLYGELVQALRRNDIKIAATFHMLRGYDWWLPGASAIQQGKEAGWDLYDPAYKEFYFHRESNDRRKFVNLWQLKVREVIDKYQPDVLWFDGGDFQGVDTRQIVLDTLCHYLNKEALWGKKVDVLNKLPVSQKFNFPRVFGMLTYEKGRDRPITVDRPWVDDMRIGSDSWGYIEGQTYESPGTLLHSLIDRVSRGGGLFLSLSPQADGTIPQAQQDVLLEMGRWLKLNGEAIYATRPWKIHAEGDLDKFYNEYYDLRRKLTKRSWRFDQADAGDIRFTRSKDRKTVYAIILGWPGAGETIQIESLNKKNLDNIQRISMPGCTQSISWNQNENSLNVTMPEKQPCDHAVVLKIDLNPTG